MAKVKKFESDEKSVELVEEKSVEVSKAKLVVLGKDGKEIFVSYDKDWDAVLGYDSDGNMYIKQYNYLTN